MHVCAGAVAYFESLSIIGPRSYHMEPYPKFLHEARVCPGARNSHIHLQHHVGDRCGHTAKPVLNSKMKVLYSYSCITSHVDKGAEKDV